jgi:alanine-glyoxylate transaminase/serine-glyoxylate transaminase/serine-pyruvate transaminase
MKSAKLPRAFWDWEPVLAAANGAGNLPYTPACNLFFGLKEALDMVAEEGLEAIFARHARHAEATRRAVRAWGLETVCAEPSEYSPSVTAVFVPEGHSADGLRKTILERFNMSLGAGLGKLADRVFRIGHLGDFNDLTLAGTLSGVEMGLTLAKVPHRAGGVLSALGYLSGVEERRAAA